MYLFCIAAPPPLLIPSALPVTRLERHVRQRGAGKRRLRPHRRRRRPLCGEPRGGDRLRLVVLATRRRRGRWRRRQRWRRQRSGGVALLLQKLQSQGAHLASQRFKALQQPRVSSGRRRRHCRGPVHRHCGCCCDGPRRRRCRCRRRRCCCCYGRCWRRRRRRF